MIRVYVISDKVLLNSVTYKDVILESDLMSDIVNKIEQRGWKYNNKGWFNKNNMYLYIDTRNCSEDIWTKYYNNYPITKFLRDVKRRAAK